MNAPYSLQAKILLDYLTAHCMGRACAKPIRDIAAALCMDRREVELLTEDLREFGIPLCSSCSKPMGLFIARNYEEMLPWVHQLDARLKSICIHRNQAVKQLKAVAEKEGIQMEMEFEHA